MFFRKSPEEVFTPRVKDVNDDMYIHREGLERALSRAIRKHKNIVVHGESGTGKTWLYKKIFSELDVYYEVLNCATVNQCGSVSDAIGYLVARLEPNEKVGHEEAKGAEGNAGFAKGHLEHTSQYRKSAPDNYLKLVRLIRKRAKSKKAFLVVENLEHIVRDKDKISELSSLLLYLDDEVYAESNVRILLVGTPNNLRDYFAEVDETQTIINRLQEIPEVSALSKHDVVELAKKGLFKILRLDFVEDRPRNFTEWYFLNAISWFSINIPQYVHDICLEVALEASDDGGRITRKGYTQALRNWVQEALVAENSRLEKNINSKETRHGRRNQVIYTTGVLSQNEFSNAEVEESLREHFPTSTEGKTLNVSSNLIELSNGTHPILSKTPKGNRYRFIDPKIKIMIRWMLQKNDDERLVVKKFDESIKF
ncbi:AAA family ATPase [Guyparkeria hydrothermalis]|uniref:AAA family ATPase n=1 Tax=Guyparkeria hydrothermalis TaxID=923 RepID=UPI00202213E9|nr:AAA family ATPase [Guyparkeria hydrothermalis]MCL7745184.1 AAA family ATPase [Guyparkeria hydrothermalis]